MAKQTIPVTLGGQHYALRYDGLVLFAGTEKFGDQNVIEACMAATAEGFLNLCWLTAQMMAAAARYETAYYERPLPVLTEQKLAATVLPADIPALRTAALEAVAAGYGREIEEPEHEQDLGLAELEKNGDRG